MNKAFLSIDCGGTKTEFLLTDAEGFRLAYSSFGPGNYMVSGLDVVAKRIQDGTEDILRATGVKAEEVTAFIAMAGYGDVPSQTEEIKRTIRSMNPSVLMFFGNDSENAIAGSLVGKSGIHVIAGTGSIAMGVDLTENKIRSGGWHHAFGDEGSAYWMSMQLLRHFSRQADGREEKTYLYEHLKTRYHLNHSEDILRLIVQDWDMERDRLAALSMNVYELALAKDPVALMIMNQAASELCEMVYAVQQRGNFMKPTLVSYSGGVFNAGDVILKPFKKCLDQFDVVLQEPALSPLAGGILLAMSSVGLLVGDSVQEHLKNSGC